MAGIAGPTVDWEGAAGLSSAQQRGLQGFYQGQGGHAYLSDMTLMKKRTARGFEQQKQRRESHQLR